MFYLTISYEDIPFHTKNEIRKLGESDKLKYNDRKKNRFRSLPSTFLPLCSIGGHACDTLYLTSTCNSISCLSFYPTLPYLGSLHILQKWRIISQKELRVKIEVKTMKEVNAEDERNREKGCMRLSW